MRSRQDLQYFVMCGFNSWCFKIKAGVVVRFATKTNCNLLFSSAKFAFVFFSVTACLIKFEFNLCVIPLFLKFAVRSCVFSTNNSPSAGVILLILQIALQTYIIAASSTCLTCEENIVLAVELFDIRRNFN